MELAILSDELSLDLDEALTEGASLGFSKYEIRCIDSYENRVPYFSDGRETRLHDAVERNEIEITALTPGVFKIELSDTENLRKEMEETLPQTCEMAVRLKAPRIIVFGFLREKGGLLKEVLQRIREAGQIAADFGLELAVENEPGSYCDTGVHTADAIRSIDLPNIGINWDPANAVVSGEAAYPIGYDAVKPFLQNVHIKDAIPTSQNKWENRLIGDGGVNWLGQLRALVNDQTLTHLTLETHVFPLLPSTREDLRRLRILLETIHQFDEEKDR